MQKEELLTKRCQLLASIISLPRKIITVHESDNACELILHELCDTSCFNIKKAAYFVDNPDFDCLRGVAGFCRVDMPESSKIDWNNPHLFSQSLQNAPFNQKVRSINKQSHAKQSASKLVDELINELEFSNHAVCAWPMKHDNHGMLVFEKTEVSADPVVEQAFKDALFLLSFCPLF